MPQKGSMANNKMSPHKKQKATTTTATTTKEQNDKHETQNTKHKTDKKPNHALTFKRSRARSLKKKKNARSCLTCSFRRHRAQSLLPSGWARGSGSRSRSTMHSPSDRFTVASFDGDCDCD